MSAFILAATTNDSRDFPLGRGAGLASGKLAAFGALWHQVVLPCGYSLKMHAVKLILASSSPRRKTLLAAAGVDFEIIESGIPEIRREDESGRDFALRMAREKASSVSLRFPGTIVLAADTIVECNGEILGKPDDAADARRMLSLLSGNTHTVVTAFALALAGAIVENIPVNSRVTFRPLACAEIDAYIATAEPLDKAGAYGIQGAGADFITRVDGSRDNVMGLPVSEVLAALRRNGI